MVGWGTFDLAVSLFSGQPVDPPSNDFIKRNSAIAEQIEVGRWLGEVRQPCIHLDPSRRRRVRDSPQSVCSLGGSTEQRRRDEPAAVIARQLPNLHSVAPSRNRNSRTPHPVDGTLPTFPVTGAS
jgi:hypothetical protein